MQTFLPYPEYDKSAQVLDYRRLGKQRVEAWQILNAMSTVNRWSNHPATRMWTGHEIELCKYGISMCKEWICRGYKDNLMERFISAIMLFGIQGRAISAPPWLGNEDFHASHRSNLLRKNPAYYGKYGWKEKNDLPYVWPV